MAKVLIIEDDPFLGPALEEYLNQKGFYAFWLSDERQWRTHVEKKWDVIVLDLILPHIPGEVILEDLKRLYPHLPVLVLTAKGELDNKKLCFEKGADDYLVKPFEVLELELRLRALLRRSEDSEKVYYVGSLKVYPDRGFILSDKGRIVLSRRAWDLLLFLLRRRGRLVSKEEILRNVWGDVLVNEETVRSYIKEIRKVLPRGVLKTFKGRGYLLE